MFWAAKRTIPLVSLVKAAWLAKYAAYFFVNGYFADHENRNPESPGSGHSY